MSMQNTWIERAGRAAMAAVLGIGFAACGTGGETAPASAAPADQMEMAGDPDPQARFWANLQTLCGGAWAGEVLEAPANDTTFAGHELVMHARVCEEDRILIPFHVGEDRSRTWVLTRTADGLRLKHDHRHSDGSEDEVTQYGGDTSEPGTENRQEFPADEFTASLIPAAATNIWTVEIVPGEEFVYALRRVGTDRRFRIRFDMDRPVDPPPAPWGHD
jgi:hypothetical protein